ncbi:unnamed protein product, partial [Trypanosoma congolense IL3000]
MWAGCGGGANRGAAFHGTGDFYLSVIVGYGAHQPFLFSPKDRKDFFSVCIYSARAPLDARLFSVLLKPAGNTDRNADTVLASFSKIVKQTACNKKAFFPSLWEATGTANDCAEGDGTSNKYGDRPLFTA